MRYRLLGRSALRVSEAFVGNVTAQLVQRIADRLEPYEFERLYSLLGGTVLADAKGAVRRSAERYIAWVSGANDHLG
jgi:hypothetical protein